MNKTFKFDLKDGVHREIEIEEFTRWACLLEAMDHAVEHLEEKEIPDSDGSWVKPLAFQKYIEEVYPARLHDVKCEIALGNIQFD